MSTLPVGLYRTQSCETALHSREGYKLGFCFRKFDNYSAIEVKFIAKASNLAVVRLYRYTAPYRVL